MTITILDLSGLKCPLPALKTRKALKSLAPGDRLEVRCTARSPRSTFRTWSG
jgi:tRNA 2-thiouridine synthesizing protein A